MDTERRMEATIAWCIATMERYHDARRTRHATLQMIGEVQAHTSWAMESGLGLEATHARIFRPVQDALMHRYGPELGARLCAEFYDAIEGSTAFRTHASARGAARV